MNAIRCVAVAVFRESVRDRVFYNLVLFAVLLVGASILIGQLTAGQDVKIIKDLGLAATSLFGLFIAIFVGISLVSKEIDRRSIYPLLRQADPPVGVHRRQVRRAAADAARQHGGHDAARFTRCSVPARGGVPANIQSAWDAPAMDPALLKAIALILRRPGASSPRWRCSSRPFPARCCRRSSRSASTSPGQFSADLKHFDADRRCAGRGGRSPRRCYYVLPDFRPVRRQARGRARPSGHRRLRGVDDRSTPSLYVAALLFGAIADLLAAGLQVTRHGRAAAGAAAALCLAGAVALHAARGPLRRRPPSMPPSLLYVRSPAVARRGWSLGYDALAADIYWMRALQHFGAERLSPPEHVRTYALLYPLLDLTTTLDPYFSIAYRFGAIYLGEPYPGGPGRPDLAVALLQKGLAAQPDEWQYMEDLGFVYYWHLHDYKAAAAMFQRAADLPGAPTWLRPLAAVTLAEGGHRERSRALWQQLAQSDEPWLRDSASQRLSQLDAMDVIDRCSARRRTARTSGRAGDLGSMAVARLPGSADPSGTPFELDPATRRDHRLGDVEAVPAAGTAPGAALMDASARLCGSSPLFVTGLCIGSFLNV